MKYISFKIENLETVQNVNSYFKTDFIQTYDIIFAMANYEFTTVNSSIYLKVVHVN